MIDDWGKETPLQFPSDFEVWNPIMRRSSYSDLITSEFVFSAGRWVAPADFPFAFPAAPNQNLPAAVPMQQFLAAATATGPLLDFGSNFDFTFSFLAAQQQFIQESAPLLESNAAETQPHSTPLRLPPRWFLIIRF